MLDTKLFHSYQQSRTLEAAWSTAFTSLLAGFELRNCVTSHSQAGESPALLVPDMIEPTLRELDVAAHPALFLFALNGFAEAVRPFEFGFYRSLGFEQGGKFPENLLTIGNFDLAVTYCGSGNFGSVFKVQDCSRPGSRAYALKVFYKRNFEIQHSGSWNETALAAYVTGQHVYNMPRLCAANPEQGWMLTEFVDEDYRNPNWSGPSWSSLGLITLDPERDNDNLIVNKHSEEFRVDFGHLKTEDRQDEPLPREILEVKARHSSLNPMSKEKFLGLFKKYPEARGRLAASLVWVAESERLETFKEISQFEEAQHFPIADYFTASVFSESQAKELFMFLMSHENTSWAAQALMDTRVFSETTRGFLEYQWRLRPAFRPFRVYRGFET